MLALKVSLRPASKEHTYGWHRAEIIGTLISVTFLVCATIWLVVEATSRIVRPQEIKTEIMVVTAISGLIFNLIQMRILHQDAGGHYHIGGNHNHEHDHEHGHPRNINVDAAYLHVLGDMIMSIGVVIASLIIFLWPSLTIADPLCTYLFSIIVCFTVSKVFSQCFSVLMEASPEELDTS